MVTLNPHTVHNHNIKTLEILCNENKINQADKISLLESPLIDKKDITIALIEQYHIDPKSIGQSLSKHTSLPFYEMIDETITTNNTQTLPDNLTYNEFILPTHQHANSITVICYSLHQIAIIKTFEKIHRKNIIILLSTHNSIITVINHLISTKLYASFTRENINQGYSIIELLNHIITDAIIRSSSDIHIHPDNLNIIIRFRIDGTLREITQLSIKHLCSIISRLKILSNLNISETRRPQDGRFRFTSRHEHVRDCRLSICPSLHGEKAVIRLLNSEQAALPLNNLYLSKDHTRRIQQAINKPQGLILITGPTGSGKTQTLYTLIKQLDNTSKNIITIENPIEITMKNIHQINIAHEINLTFYEALKTTLRQDPDIIMIGEIRDKETASMAIQASQTGHLVLSTLHANTAMESITRLINMGIEPYNLSSSLSLIIAQRLVKKLCVACRNSNITRRDRQNNSIKNSNDKPELPQCHYCTNGYVGRLPILEILSATEEVKKILLKKEPHEALHIFFQRHNIPTLWDSVNEKINANLTSLDEALTSIPKHLHEETL